MRDNGAGIPRNLGQQHGMGLQIMHYRAKVIGGSLTVQRDPRGGTRAVCTVAHKLLAKQGRIQK